MDFVWAFGISEAGQCLVIARSMPKVSWSYAGRTFRERGAMVSPVKFPELRAEREPRSVNIGDLVQWTNGGVDQFETPRRVRDIRRHDGKEWAFIEGTRTGVPVSELTVVTPKSGGIARPSTTAPSERAPSDQAAVTSISNEREYLRGLLSRDACYRLLVSGDIGPKELGKMIKLLQAQKAILEDDPDREERGDF